MMIFLDRVLVKVIDHTLRHAALVVNPSSKAPRNEPYCRVLHIMLHPMLPHGSVTKRSQVITCNLSRKHYDMPQKYYVRLQCKGAARIPKVLGRLRVQGIHSSVHSID